MQLRIILCVISIAVMTFLSSIWKDQKNGAENNNLRKELIAQNVEALTQNEIKPHEPAWWDFFNNYVVKEMIPVTTSECVNGSFSYKGATIKVEDCMNYSYVEYWHCYDGGDNDECTSSGAHGYL